MSPKRFQFVSPIAWCCLLGLLPASARAAGLFDGADGNARPEAGKEVKVHDPDVGGAGYYSVFLPADYTGKRPFPIIFSYHGQFEEPQAAPFRQITGGKGFIIVGMDYRADSIPQARLVANVIDPMVHEVDVLRRVAAGLRADLKIDPKQMFVGGFSRGALQAQAIAARAPELWSGVIVLGAGRGNDPQSPKNPSGLPYLIACGDEDADYPAAKLAADFYKRLGADVTFETFGGKPHVVDTGDPALSQWLIKYGPHRQITAAMAAAQAAIKANKMGEALNQYAAVSSMEPSPQDAQVAAAAARTLTENASASLKAAEEAITRRDFGAAARELIGVSSAYAGNDFGRRAADRLKAIQADPAVVKAIAQAKIDSDSDVLESQAATAELAGDYQRAIAAYQLYLSRFSSAHHAEQVRAKLAALQSDKTILAKQADLDCRSWLSLADNCIRSGLPDKARPYLQKIVEIYGTTPWADEARARLKTLDGTN